MEQKINIAELLKDCPRGMELDCTLYDDITLFGVDDMENTVFPIRVLRKDGASVELTKYGQYTNADFAKCIIFPKGKTTWGEFVPPYKFKDGDIVATKNGQWIGIATGDKSDCSIPTYCVIKYNSYFKAYLNYKEKWRFDRLATKEEKEKLFQAIKENGYKWNPETKTLEKLPKFKVGDRIIYKDGSICCTLGEYSEGISAYRTDIGGLSLTYKDLEQWELAPNKFDSTTLKAFDKVLVRPENSHIWECDIFSSYNSECSNPYHCIGAWYEQCIPYEGNEHLLGTTDDCDNFYKN